MATPIIDNPFALLNPGPLPPRIPNTFGPPPGTIMPNSYDMIKTMLDAQQQASQQYHGQTINQPYTAAQLVNLFPGPSQTPEQQIQKVLDQQNADTQRYWGKPSGNPLTAAQIMQQYPANINPYPAGVSPGSGLTGASPSLSATTSPISAGSPWPNSVQLSANPTARYMQDRSKPTLAVPTSLNTNPSSLSSAVIPGVNGRTASSMGGWGRSTLGGK